MRRRQVKPRRMVMVLLSYLLCIPMVDGGSSLSPQVVACLVDPPGYPWTPLPALLSLRPSSTDWNAEFLISGQPQGLAALACLAVSPDSNGVTIQLSDGQCLDNTTSNSNDSISWPDESPQQDSWIPVSVVQNQNSLEVSVSGTTPVTLSGLPHKLFLHSGSLSAVSVSYNCHDSCHFSSTSDHRQTLAEVLTNESVSVSLYPLPGFLNVTFEDHLYYNDESRIIGTLGLVVDNYTLKLEDEVWNTLQVTVRVDRFLVTLNGRCVVHKRSPTASVSLEKVDLVVAGPAWWTYHCHPSDHPPSSTASTATMTTITSTTTATSVTTTTGEATTLGQTNFSQSEVSTQQGYKIVLYTYFIAVTLKACVFLLNLFIHF